MKTKYMALVTLIPLLITTSAFADQLICDITITTTADMMNGIQGKPQHVVEEIDSLGTAEAYGILTGPDLGTSAQISLEYHAVFYKNNFVGLELNDLVLGASAFLNNEAITKNQKNVSLYYASHTKGDSYLSNIKCNIVE